MRFVFAAFAACFFAGCFSATGPSPDFFRGDLVKEDLVGEWILVLDNRNQEVESEDHRVEILGSGTFRAHDVPLIFARMEPARFISDAGSFELKETTDKSNRYRWKLSMVFEGFRREVKWDLINHDGEVGLLYRTELDTARGFVFRRK